MKVNVDKVLLDLEGKEILRSDNSPMKIKELVIQSLTILNKDDEKMTGDERYKLFDIAQRITKDASSVDLKSEEIALIKQRIGVMFQPLVVGRVYDVLEGKEDAS